MSYTQTIDKLLKQTFEDNSGAIATKLKNESFTFGDLDTLSTYASTWFTEAGLKGDPVAFMLPNGFETLITYIACFKSGAVAMPLNRQFTAPELNRILADSGARWIIIEREKVDLLHSINLNETGIEKIFITGVIPLQGCENFYTLLGLAAPYKETEHDPDDPALILYTSGSSGKPEGVTHTYNSVIGIIESTASALDGVGRTDRMIVTDPQVHISGFLESFTVLGKGGSVTIQDGFNPANLVKAIDEDRPTLHVTHIDAYMKLLDSGLTTKNTFKSFRAIYAGGNALPSALQTRYKEETGLPVRLGYGMTEAIWLTVERDGDISREGNIGRPVEGVTVRITDSEGNECKDGEPGEIWIKGDMVMAGYWKNEKATEEVFSDGWFRTGDLGVKGEDGNYYYTGQISHKEQAENRPGRH